MLVIRDKNMAAPHKGGNQYATLCPECKQRQFCSKSRWIMADPAFVIQRGENEAKPLWDCPYDDCDGEFVGQPDKCPECEREFEWE